MKAFPALTHANLANGITSLSVVASMGAMFLAMNGCVPAALILGAVTLPCDVLDGVVARRRGTASAFGAQLDSLSDVIGFGVLPAFLGHALGVRGIGMLALAGYALAAVWRLAHFHEVGMTSRESGPAFQGMPTTFAAALFYLAASAVLWMPAVAGRAALALFFLVAALLMSGGFAFPKRGWHTRLLWLLVPAALITLFFRRW